jgi:hypothetical protein
LAAALKSKQQSREEESAKSAGVDPRSSDHLKDTLQPQYEDEVDSLLGLNDLVSEFSSRDLPHSRYQSKQSTTRIAKVEKKLETLESATTRNG